MAKTKTIGETRRGRPSTTYTANTSRYGRVTITSDAEGVVKISNEAERVAADAFHLRPGRPVTKPPAPAAEQED
jgi:hypothetical protein